MKGKYYWIKERHNPQLGIYYVAMGQITVKQARSYERVTLYGDNFMHKFTTKQEYDAEIIKLQAQNAKVQGV